MRDAKTFYEDSYISIKAKTDAELQTLIRSKRDSVDPVSIATRAMCKYELLSRADQARKTTRASVSQKPQTTARPASVKNKRKAQQIIESYNEKRRSKILEKMSPSDPDRENKSICEIR